MTYIILNVIQGLILNSNISVNYVHIFKVEYNYYYFFKKIIVIIIIIIIRYKGVSSQCRLV